MKSYTLTQISGTDFTVSLDGTPLAVTEFENVFYSEGEAQLISDVDASGFTIWDSDQKDGNSISSTAEITSAIAYNATWADIASGATSNTFTSVEEADGIGLTKFQLSELMGKIKDAGSIKTLHMSELPEGGGKHYVPYELNGLYEVVNDLGGSQTLYVASVRTPVDYYCIDFHTISSGDKEYVLLDKNIAVAFKGNAGGVTVFKDSILFGDRAQGGISYYVIKNNLVVNDLKSTQTEWVLSAKQGKVLNETKLSVANLLAGSGVTLTTAGSGANQTITIDADSAPAFTTNEWNALWS